MKNTRTLISSSIVSFVIVTLGLFMLCMSRAPHVNYDEPLIDGGGVASDSVQVSDEDFLKLLDEASGDNSQPDDNQQLAEDNSNSGDDSQFSDIWNEGTGENTATEQSPESGDEGMAEILRLLEIGDDAGNTSAGEDGGQKLTATEYGESGGSSENASLSSNSADQLTEEIDRLEGVLADRSTEIQSLQTEIDDYNKKIAEFDSDVSSSAASNTIQKASYQETSASEESETREYETHSPSFSSDDFETNYNSVMELCLSRQYPQAIDGFYALLQQNPHHDLADNCQYWLGECYYARGDYFQAVAEFNKVLAFESPDKQDDAQLMLGLAFMKIGERNMARSELDWLLSCYDASEYVNKANFYLERL
ncbi:MAG: tetratricopeptide repeat protein [Candidatus Zhuqueibacterota bacterium]